ncbi:energy-coupling factor transporter ATPase [Mycoplasma iguanae]|uniref:Energy-coupling factor transporter ATP-binding protein EcfA2 n=1 Tax=Mycoplasma iguanae TaxID=292461 RepID=A0ABY5R7L5_9MOLU|nr:energy-coupling factor transporter ATPase [Mycoplasma iguanae]UVD81449.1 energy-coupling factor transporter ATPase [Mycoplasma iguanae]
MQINTKNIVKVYDKGLKTEFNAIDDVTAEIKQGEFIAIIGQTGSGKTTFIEHLNSLLVPDKGQVEYFYRDLDKKTKEEINVYKIVKKKFFQKIKKIKEIRRRVGIVFQFAEYQLFESTVEKDIMFGPLSMGVSKEEAQERAKKYIELVGLSEDFLKKNPLNLSGGQKRRVAIAGILSMEPDILIFDEPTAGLDPFGIHQTLETFDKIHKLGKTIIMVTHDLDNVLEWTKRVIVFKKGKIIKDGPTYDVLEDVDFLAKNNMKPPKILAFRDTLKQKGIDLGKVKSISEMANKITGYLKTKIKNKK